MGVVCCETIQTEGLYPQFLKSQSDVIVRDLDKGTGQTSIVVYHFGFNPYFMFNLHFFIYKSCIVNNKIKGHLSLRQVKAT